MTIFTLQGLIKFAVFFLVPYKARRKQLDKSYVGKQSATTKFDIVILFVLVLLTLLLFISERMEYLSFITGLYIGMTLIQVYFHQFNKILPEDKAPEAPYSPIKLMSYGIQAFPKKPWKELLLMALLLGWGLFKLLKDGFHLW
ncbi:hypothetical protein DBR32_14025 [Taibaiella sp. KBW10]|nr:hypothetical protein DBR32_14025 [Taibaiella sp. KBW10]